jgi:hypothetical protein
LKVEESGPGIIHAILIRVDLPLVGGPQGHSTHCCTLSDVIQITDNFGAPHAGRNTKLIVVEGTAVAGLQAVGTLAPSVYKHAANGNRAHGRTDRKNRSRDSGRRGSEPHKFYGALESMDRSRCFRVWSRHRARGSDIANYAFVVDQWRWGVSCLRIKARAMTRTLEVYECIGGGMSLGIPETLVKNSTA